MAPSGWEITFVLIQELNGFPYLFKTELSQFRDDERKISEYAIEQFKAKLDPAMGNNVELDKTPKLERIWNAFFDVCDEYFINLTQIENYYRHGAVWTYVQNKESFSDVWHCHITTASINGVYYPSVPDPTGTLSIIATNGEIYDIEVVQGWLYLFPGWLIHKPNPQKNSLEPRVSINVELLTVTRPILRLSSIEPEKINTGEPSGAIAQDVLW